MGSNKANFSENKRKRNRCAGNKNKNIDCFNYGKPDHFARDCTELKVLYDQNRYPNPYVNSCLMLAETVSYLTVGLATTDHIAKD